MVKSLIALFFSPIRNKMMKSLLLIFIFGTVKLVWADQTNFLSFFNQHWKVNERMLSQMLKNEILVDAKVQSQGEQQSFTMHVAAIHKTSCVKALRKLSQFEMFSEWISFITHSTYDEKNRLWTVRADHALLPYPMLVHIIVDRPTKTGRYNFVFPTGIFTGLAGHFIIEEIHDQCSFYATSFWQGPHTKLPNFVIEIFSQTLTKIGGELIFRKIQ
jgi:hypothetical protein